LELCRGAWAGLCLAMALNRCCGTTRKGLRCSITASSGLTDDRGRLIGAPLQRGGNYCRLHSRPCCAFPAEFDAPAVVLLLDLETTGVDVASDQIVELAAYHAPIERHARGAGGGKTRGGRERGEGRKDAGKEGAERRGKVIDFCNVVPLAGSRCVQGIGILCFSLKWPSSPCVS